MRTILNPLLFCLIITCAYSQELGSLHLTSYASADLNGKLFMPDEGGDYPVSVVIVGGSEGGLGTHVTFMAAELAKRGYPTLALAYFNADSLPSKMENIPLEYFHHAASFLKDQSHAQPKSKVIFIGHSRGAEGALLAASTSSIINGVVAYTPSHFVCTAPGGTKEKHAAAWSYKGQSVDYLIPHQLSNTTQYSSSLAAFEIYLSDTLAVKNHEIPVELIQGPVLLLSAGDDRVWQSQWMSLKMMERLKKKEFKYSYRHINYPSAGHMLLSVTGGLTEYTASWGTIYFGGTKDAQALACRAAWSEVLNFLSEVSSR